MTRKPLLIIMAKAPRLGQGKQRLAAQIGAAQALRINRSLHALTLRAAHDPRWRTLLAVAPASAVTRAAPGVWPPPSTLPRIAQGQGDLGARIARCVRRARRGPVCVIGVDAPDLRRADIAAAFKALRRDSAVLGLARDGGFWLVGAQSPPRLAAAMAGVRWSTAHAGADMAARLPRPLARLRVQSDIDTAEDWRAAQAHRAAWRRSNGA